MYSWFHGCWTPLECTCLQVQSELRRWLRKCHSQSHLTPAKRSITQITIRTREGLAGPPSSGNISSVWSFKNCPRGRSGQVQHRWPLSKLQAPHGIISTAHLREEHCWELHEYHQQLELRPQTLFIDCVLLPVPWSATGKADVAKEKELRGARYVAIVLQRDETWGETELVQDAGTHAVVALLLRGSDCKREQMWMMNSTEMSEDMIVVGSNAGWCKQQQQRQEIEGAGDTDRLHTGNRPRTSSKHVSCNFPTDIKSFWLRCI